MEETSQETLNVQKSLRQKNLRLSNTSANIVEYGKIPPQAIELEEVVLGAIMLEKDALTSVIDIIKPDVFYKQSHQVIFKAITRLFAKAEPVDILTVTNELKFMGELELAGGAFYIAKLTNNVASTANTEFHARIILQKFIQRELIRVSSEIITDAYEDTTDVFNLLDKAESQLFNISETNMRRNYLDMELLIRDAVKQIELSKDSTNNLRGIPSGFIDLDRVTSGWQPSDLIIVAARPGMGKTAFVLSIARNVAVDFAKGVAVFSLEMSSIQLVTRLISAETKITAEKLKKGELEAHEWSQLNKKITPLIDAPIFIDDTPSLSIFEMRAKCRRLKAQHDIQLIIIDYIQLMSAGSERGGNREQEISSISRSLKSLAKELNVPVIALSQLNRSVEMRPSKKPLLSDLRESGAIEQDADMVIFIYRPDYYKDDNIPDDITEKGIAEINIAKHRNGALASVNLRFISHFAQFVNIDNNDFNNSFGNVSPNAEFDTSGNSYSVISRMDEIDDNEPPY